MGASASPARLVESPEFAVAYAWGLVFLGVGGPLLAECHRHLLDGHVLFGCVFGGAALFVGGVCLWRIWTALGGLRPGLRRRTGAEGD